MLKDFDDKFSNENKYYSHAELLRCMLSLMIYISNGNSIDDLEGSNFENKINIIIHHSLNEKSASKVVGLIGKNK